METLVSFNQISNKKNDKIYTCTFIPKNSIIQFHYNFNSFTYSGKPNFTADRQTFFIYEQKN